MNWELKKRDPQGGGRGQGDHKWQANFLPALVSRGGYVGGVCTVGAVGPTPTVSHPL